MPKKTKKPEKKYMIIEFDTQEFHILTKDKLIKMISDSCSDWFYDDGTLTKECVVIDLNTLEEVKVHIERLITFKPKKKEKK